MKKIVLTLFVYCFCECLIGCGGVQNGTSLALQIEDARQPASITLPSAEESLSLKTIKANNKGLDPLKVSEFRVVVSGEDMEDLQVTADANAKEIQVLKITPGKRNLLIEAYNELGEVIRRRTIKQIVIKAGVVTPIKTSLFTVPIILNYKNKAVALEKNFRIIGFGEPGNHLKLNAQTPSAQLSLNEAIDGTELLIIPSISTGLFTFQPETVALGRQVIELSDEKTGEASTREITIVDADHRPGSHFATGNHLISRTSVGNSYGNAKILHLPSVMKELGAQE
ncbi:MAG: hypothetical protein COX62_08185 [Deltaproteobacteria bacterium CG_4_10_14_0_2_um_filter_43_8]|nr:MAG: hypothetical protein COV43_07885 [Deltaproteobacteria bacterium CG11_big_fil_rev_8_21_14_0_20_42_23]PJA18768.1 MAG: hypothetical protein COX62_08185 [Deltaproteobacteria bacterium CG_4_10_14_0_2_um_filter_43_8]PJC63912.1 MAG: hypothetical protein CO021_07040 [Deltaproteobacteria bacterium CG_4_9_14_0_2_um_filter_42_21]